uniref:RRM domain-containing protein n=1 Tax=Acrobeloides nanus TaxID=290746 RepID=A0A914C1I7_9BILA
MYILKNKRYIYMANVFKDAPEGYVDYVELIEFNRGEGNLSAANETREEFSQKFPLHPQIWLDWINDEINAGSDSDQIESLFERAFQDFQSCDVCLKYMEWTTTLDMSVAKSKLERVLQIIGIRPDCASLVWETYLDIEEGTLSVMGETSEEADQQRSKIEALYGRALRIPHQKHADVWQKYTDFMGENKIPKKIRDEYEAAAKSYDEMTQFEEKISNLEDHDEASRTAFQEYIYFEIEKGDPARVQMIFERALVEFPFDPSLWEDYVRWLDSSLKIHSVIVGVYNRACKMCYDYIPLLQRALLALERAGFAYEDILEVWEQAKASITTPEDGLSIYRTFIYLTRRKIVKEGSNDFSAVNDLFKEASEKLSQEFGPYWDSTTQFRKDHAYFLFVKMKNSNEARKIWKDILASGNGHMASIWLEGIALERHFGSIAEARKMFYRAVNSVSDEPYKIFESFIQFEREEGTVDELDKALEKVNAQAERVRTREAEKKNKQGQKQKGGEGNERKRKQQTDSQQVSKPNKQPKFEPTTPGNPKAVTKLAETMSNVKVKSETPAQQKVDADGFAVPVGLPPAKRRPSLDEHMEVGPSGVGDQKAERKVDPNSIDAARTVFISNFKFNVEREKFFEVFENVQDVRIISTGKNRYGYVDFVDENSAKAALSKDRTMIDGRPLFVSPYNPHERGEKAAFKFGTGLERSKLFVKNVHYNATADDLKNLFSRFGNVKDVRIVMHKSGQSKGCAYVEYETEKEANVALLSNEELKIRGRTLQIFLSNPPQKSDQQPKPSAKNAIDEQPTQRVARSSRVSFVPRSIAAKTSANGSDQNGSASTSKGLSNEDFKKLFNK